MRRFRFIGNPGHYFRWDSPPVYNKIYNREEYCGIRGGADAGHVFDTVVSSLSDWKEVFEEPQVLFEEPQVFNRVGFNKKPLHKDTDLGAFSIEILRVLVAKNYDPAMGFSNSYEDMASIAKNVAKELIKQLDNEK